jgi:hypothetical protein
MLSPPAAQPAAVPVCHDASDLAEIFSAGGNVQLRSLMTVLVHDQFHRLFGFFAPPFGRVFDLDFVIEDCDVNRGTCLAFDDDAVIAGKAHLGVKVTADMRTDDAIRQR